jgi:hypothetical protein
MPPCQRCSLWLHGIAAEANRNLLRLLNSRDALLFGIEHSPFLLAVMPSGVTALFIA